MEKIRPGVYSTEFELTPEAADALLAGSEIGIYSEEFEPMLEAADALFKVLLNEMERENTPKGTLNIRINAEYEIVAGENGEAVYMPKLSYSVKTTRANRNHIDGDINPEGMEIMADKGNGRYRLIKAAQQVFNFDKLRERG
ncbi:MAG: hypothetical protein IKR59_02970 [Lachnospiraceae bacterium]|nr:hypothetical protein [Lachnospiraceae bacterium]